MRGQGANIVADEQDNQRYYEPGEILVAPGHTYLVTGLLGEGGMGRVYAAVDRDTHREVAVKVLLLEHALRKGDIAARFDREARLPGLVLQLIKNQSTRMATKYLLPVTAIGQLSDGTPYYAMARLSGCTLQSQVQSVNLRAKKLGHPAGLPVANALNIVLELLVSLEALHHCGVVHRDIKPANIFLHKPPGEKASVVLLDYGIAHLMDEGGRAAFAGTAGYAAPEHFSGEIGPPADIFAVGVLLFSLLAGVKPARFAPAWPRPNETRTAPSLGELGVVPALAELVARCLSLHPRERPTAGDLYKQLEVISNALPEVDVATAVTEDDPFVQAAGEEQSSTGISVADCSPATSPDIAVPARMSALRKENDRRSRLGLPLLTHAPNHETTPMMGRPIITKPVPAPVIRTGGPRQETVPMGRVHISPLPADVATVPPASLPRSASAFGPVSAPEYVADSARSSNVAFDGIDSVIARLPDRSVLAEAVRRAAQSSTGMVGDGRAAPASTPGTMTALARTSDIEPRATRGLLGGLATILSRGAPAVSKSKSARRSERELAAKQRQVEENRRLRREAEARGEQWTGGPGDRKPSWRLPLAMCVAAACIAAAGVVVVRRNATAAGAAAVSADLPTSIVLSSAAPPIASVSDPPHATVSPSAVSSVVAAPSSAPPSTRAIVPRTTPASSHARAARTATGATPPTAPSAASTAARAPQVDFE